MSRSSYERTSKTASGNYDRDYDERKERERDRQKSADRYDSSESRHHGKWTASGESVDLENASLPSAYGEARKSASHPAPRSFSERENYNNDQTYRSRSASYNNYDDYGYGSVPNPPPMPPTDFWRPQSNYRQSHPYSPQFGSSSHDGSSYAGMHPTQSGHHLHQGTGNFQRDLQARAAQLMPQSYGGYGSRDLGYGHQSVMGSSFGAHPAYGHQSVMGSSFGAHPSYQSVMGSSFGAHPSYGHQSVMGSSFGAHPAYGHQSYEYLNSGYPYDQGLYEVDHVATRGISTGVHSRHLELGTTRPHVDIYELGNEYIIELDMPGHTRDHIETKLFGNELVITSRPPKRDFKFHINERPLGQHEVTRKFHLPTDVSTTKIGATLTNGVLRVVLPRGAPVVASVPSTTTTIDTTGTTTTTTQAVVV